MISHEPRPHGISAQSHALPTHYRLIFPVYPTSNLSTGITYLPTWPTEPKRRWKRPPREHTTTTAMIDHPPFSFPHSWNRWNHRVCCDLNRWCWIHPLPNGHQVRLPRKRPRLKLRVPSLWRGPSMLLSWCQWRSVTLEPAGIQGFPIGILQSLRARGFDPQWAKGLWLLNSSMRLRSEIPLQSASLTHSMVRFSYQWR